MISPLPGVTTLLPGSATHPLPGVMPTSSTKPANRCRSAAAGTSVIRRPWPGMLRGIWGDDDRYRQTYWSSSRISTSRATAAAVTCDGNYWFMGRIDDVMNVSGHRISTAEVESAFVGHQQVAEAAVCGKIDDLTGQAIYAFVTLRGGHAGSPELADELRDHVAEKLGKFTRPKYVTFTPELPKTRSGKIMRRLLRDIAEGRTLGDTTTLADSGVVKELQIRAHDEAAKRSRRGR